MISRWLCEATPPETRPDEIPDPGGIAENNESDTPHKTARSENRGHRRLSQDGRLSIVCDPSGIDVLPGAPVRWCRFAQPPANDCNPSGIKTGAIRSGRFRFCA